MSYFQFGGQPQQHSPLLPNNKEIDNNNFSDSVDNGYVHADPMMMMEPLEEDFFYREDTPSEASLTAATEESSLDDSSLEFHRLPSCKEKQIYKAPDPELTESLIAKQMAGLSMKDREEVYFDIHGVSGVVNEEAEPGFLDRKLQELSKELDLIDATEKQAFLLAQRMNPLYVWNRDLMLRFLRSDRFDAQAAAQRYVNHYQLKLELFGAAKLASCITQEDLGDECMDSLYAGFNQLLPQRDSAGRAVGIYVTNPKQQTYSEQALMRRCFYNAMMITDDIETQRKGYVVIIYSISQGSPRRDPKGINIIWKFGTAFRSIPISLVSIHFCYNKVAWLPIMSILQLASDLFLRLRFRAHRGTHAECMYTLQTFGIPVESIPICPNGQVLEVGHREFLQKRLLQEQQWKAICNNHAASFRNNNNNTNTNMNANRNNNNNNNTGMGMAANTTTNNNYNNSTDEILFANHRIAVPSRSDVLLGRGKGYFTHVGNIRYRSLIEDLKVKYNAATSDEKHQITQEVVEIVYQSGGRFLKDDGAGWVVVEENVARLKVSHSFRATRKHQQSSSATNTTSSTTATVSSSSADRTATLKKSTSASRDLESSNSNNHDASPVKRPRAG